MVDLCVVFDVDKRCFMSIRKIILFFADFLILCGLYQFYFGYIMKKGHYYLKEGEETLLEYIVREFPTKRWQKRLENPNFSLTRYFRIRKIFGVVLLVLGIAMIIGIWVFAETKYGFLIDVVL